MTLSGALNALAPILTVLIPAVFGALGIVLVAKVNKTPHPADREDAVAKRMETLVDKLTAELERRDERDNEKDAEVRALRQEVDVLHRLVSACYKILLDHGLELPRSEEHN